jgi:acetyl-CoA synthetase
MTETATAAPAPAAQGVCPPKPEIAATAHADAAKYAKIYATSVSDPNAPSGEQGKQGDQGKQLDWIKPSINVKKTSFDYHNVSIEWFEDETLSVCANCVDHHLTDRAHQTAII